MRILGRLPRAGPRWCRLPARPHVMPEKLTVLRAITRLNIGGPAIHAILLTRGLQNERFRSVLVSGQESPGEGNMLDLAERCGVRPMMLETLGREVSPL